MTELVLFGVKGKLRTLKPGRTQVNIIVKRKREHSRKPDEIYDIIQRCSPRPCNVMEIDFVNVFHPMHACMALVQCAVYSSNA